jgi:hypothetical protein
MTAPSISRSPAAAMMPSRAGRQDHCLSVEPNGALHVEGGNNAPDGMAARWNVLPYHHSSRRTVTEGSIMRVSGKLSWYRLATAGLLTASLAACGGSPAPQPKPSGSPATTGMCATSEKKGGVEHCTRLFPGNEPIRLPADPSATQKYGAVTRSGKAFYTRTGDLPLAPVMLDRLGEDAKPGQAPYANAVYLATVTNGSVTDRPGRVSALRCPPRRCAA